MQKVFREIKENIIFESRDHLDFPAHIHENIELVLTKEGGGTAYCDGERYTLSKNSFFIAFPNQVHHYSDCLDGEYIVLIIKPSVLLGYNNIFGEYSPVSSLWSFEKGKDDNTVYLTETALQEYERDGYSVIIEAYLTALFCKLLKFYKTEKNKVPNDTVSRILEYCTAHYKEDIIIEDVAKNTHMSRSSVSHIFSCRLGMNFCDYINSLRLSDAVHLLKNTNSSITEISYLSGFSTVRTFNRAFLKRYGISPSDFRKIRIFG